MKIRRTASLAVVAAVLGTGALAAPAAPAAHAEVEGRTRGYDLRCSARLDGQPVQIDVHDSSRGYTYYSVFVGRGEDKIVGYSEADGYVTGGRVRATTDLEGDPVTLTGSTRSAGEPQRFARRTENGTGTYITRGTRTPVRTYLRITWRGTTAPVSCRWASAFDTTTTKQ